MLQPLLQYLATHDILSSSALLRREVAVTGNKKKKDDTSFMVLLLQVIHPRYHPTVRNLWEKLLKALSKGV